MLNTMYYYKFPDGKKVYFFNGNRRNHIVTQPNETVSFGIKIDDVVFKEVQISYAEWNKRYGKEDS